MNNKEAIDELSVLYERLSHPEDCEQGVYSFRDGDYLDAIRYALKALEFQHKIQYGDCDFCKHRYTAPTEHPCCVCGNDKVNGYFEMWEEVMRNEQSE